MAHIMGLYTAHKYLNINRYREKDFYIRECIKMKKGIMNLSYLTTQQLANRWKMQAGTIRLWRWYGKGPPHYKMGGRVLYRIEEIKEFEKEQQRYHTSMPLNVSLNLEPKHK